MSFSSYAGVSIVPTLSRIVLATVFITAGYKKVFSSAEYSLEQARKLQSWNIAVTPPPAVAYDDRELRWEVVTASFRQTQPTASPADEVAQATQPAPPEANQPETTQPAHPTAPPPESLKPAEPPPAESPVVAPAVTPGHAPATTEPSAATATPPASAPGAPTTYSAKAMWQIALMLDQAGWPQPKTQAWIAAFTELGGGALLLIGLFSRVWGLGLSIVMGVAFYFTSFPALQAHGWNPNALPFSDFGTMATQIALFVLAFGILLTGPGPLSIDRILFGGPREDVDVVEVKRDRG